MAFESKRQLLISRGWVQAVAIVMIFGFTVMGMLAYRTYTGEPPIPARVTDDSGRVLFTRTDILAGQAVFLRNGLMEYGSIFGHGAYLGPDSRPTTCIARRSALWSFTEEKPPTGPNCRQLPISRTIATTLLPTR